MFMRVEFKNGTPPYVFFGSVEAVENDYDRFRMNWNTKIKKTNEYGMVVVATEKEGNS